MPPGKGRLSCCTGLLPFIRGAQLAQLSACPRLHTPGWVGAAAGNHSLAPGSLADTASKVGRAGWGQHLGLPGPGGQITGGVVRPPPMPLPTQLRPGQQVGGLQALEARGGFLHMQRSRCLRGAGPSLCGRFLRPLPCSAWRTFIRAHRNGVGALEEGGRTASPCRFIS